MEIYEENLLEIHVNKEIKSNNNVIKKKVRSVEKKKVFKTISKMLFAK